MDFNKMVEELGSIETLKTDFFSNVSHEIKELSEGSISVISEPGKGSIFTVRLPVSLQQEDMEK